jgi:hypothetical protein
MRNRSALSAAAAFVVAGAASLTLGCTPAAVQYVNGAIQVGGYVCQGAVVASGDPALAPICAYGEEIAQAIADLAQQAQQSGTAAAALAPASNAALYKQIVANRAKKASSK